MLMVVTNQKRVLPFGYTYVDGRPAPDAAEAAVVRQVFAKYVADASYKSIADHLSHGEVPYHANTLVWNKHMVKRILENRRYLGANDLPALVDEDTFQAAETVRLGKTRGYAPAPPETEDLRGKARCALCGKRLLRDTRPGHARWLCEGPSGADGGDSHPAIVIREDALITGVGRLLTRLVQDPGLVEMPATEIGAISQESLRLQNELRRELEKRGCDEARAIALILAAAAERYAMWDSGEAAREARRLRRRFSEGNLQKEFDADLFNDTIHHVAVHPGGRISVFLTTGQEYPAVDSTES